MASKWLIAAEMALASSTATPLATPIGTNDTNGTEKTKRDSVPSIALEGGSLPVSRANTVFSADSQTAALMGKWREAADRLRGIECPERVPLARWKALASDADRFLTQGWARLAAGLGWDTRSLFACHPRCPLVRYDVRGVLWSVDGNEIIALSDHGLVIRTPTRARLMCRRPSFAAGEPAVMPWELTAQGEPSDAA